MTPWAPNLRPSEQGHVVRRRRGHCVLPSLQLVLSAPGLQVSPLHHRDTGTPPRLTALLSPVKLPEPPRWLTLNGPKHTPHKYFHTTYVT